MKNQNPIKIITSCICAYALLYTSVVNAAAYQSHYSIQQAAKTFISAHVASKHNQRPEITAAKLDPRLKLKKCNRKLQAFMPKGSRSIGKTTVGIKCTSPKPWSLHVPVTISLYTKVMVSARQLHKGSVLTASDVKLVKRDLSGLSYGHYEDMNRAIGMKLKRRAAKGVVLTPSMLQKPQIIARGQNVSILAQSGNMQVRMSGKALSNGAIGDRIKVINLKSRKKLEGIITLSGEVKVEI